MTQLTRLTLSHNKIVNVPPNIADLVNLQVKFSYKKNLNQIPSLRKEFEFLDPHPLE